MTIDVMSCNFNIFQIFLRTYLQTLWVSISYNINIGFLKSIEISTVDKKIATPLRLAPDPANRLFGERSRLSELHY